MIVPIRSRRSSRVAIVYGAVAADAAPDEQDVLVEVDAVQQTLTALGFAPVAVPLTLDLEAVRQRLLHIRPAFVFNLVESVEGLGRLIHLASALYESLGLPYTGAGSEAMYLTSNKPLAKRLMASAGIPTPEWGAAAAQGLSAPAFAGPYIVKSAWEHASIGIDESSVVEDGRKVAAVARKRQRRFGGDWFAERFIDGREFNLSLLGSPLGVELLPPAEMLFVDYPAQKRRIVDYAAKWHAGSFEFRNTVRRFDFDEGDRPLLAQLEAIAGSCWRLFGLRGYARVDCRVDAAGRPWVLEVNINPCLSPDAGFAAAAACRGLDLAAVVRRIIEETPAKNVEPASGRQVAAVTDRGMAAIPQALP
jgi:D-alanine-D-alanine ligase